MCKRIDIPPEEYVLYVNFSVKIKDLFTLDEHLHKHSPFYVIIKVLEQRLIMFVSVIRF